MASKSDDTNINRKSRGGDNIYTNESPLIVTISEKLWIGLGSISVLIAFIISILFYCLGRQHGRTDERLIFLEGLAVGETYRFNPINRKENIKWQSRTDALKVQEYSKENHSLQKAEE